MSDDAHQRQFFLPAILLRIGFITLSYNIHIVESSAINAIISDPITSWDIFPSSVVSPRQWIILVADVIAASCVYHICKAVIDSEEEEGKMEQQLCNGKKSNFLIPGVLRPDRGWIFGLPSKVALDLSQNDNAHNEASDSLEEEAATISPQIPIISLQQLPIIPSILYLINPISVLSANRSLRSVYDMFLLLSIYYATSPIRTINNATSRRTKSGAKCALFLALATQLDVAYGVFLIPILLWRGAFRDPSPREHSDWGIVLVLSAAYYLALYVLRLYFVEGGMLEKLLQNVSLLELDESGSYAGPNIGLHW